MDCPRCGLSLDDYTLVPAYRHPAASPFAPPMAADPRHASLAPALQARAGTGDGWTGLGPMADYSSRPPWSDAAPLGLGGIPPFTEATQRRPARPAEPASDVVVPLLQAIISAGITLLVSSVVVVTYEWDGRLPFVACAAVLGVVWTWRLVAHSEALWVHQHIVNRPEIPAATEGPSSYVVHVELAEKGGAAQLDDLPSPSPDGLYRFARAIVGGRANFCERDANHFGYARPMWRDADGINGLANKFLNHRPPWAVDRGGRLGLVLTGRGEAIMRMIAHTPPDGPAPCPAGPAPA